MVSRFSRSTSANPAVAAADSSLGLAYPAEADLGARVLAEAQAALLDDRVLPVSRVALMDRSAAPVWSAQAWWDDPAPVDSYQAGRCRADLYQVDQYQADRFPVDQDFPASPVAGLADSASVWEYQVVGADSDPAGPYQDGSAFRVLPAVSTAGPADCPEVCSRDDSPVHRVGDYIPVCPPGLGGR